MLKIEVGFALTAGTPGGNGAGVGSGSFETMDSISLSWADSPGSQNPLMPQASHLKVNLPPLERR